MSRGTHILTFVFVLLVATVISAAARAEKRVALVVGNSKYVHAAELKNPANDAEAMAQTLARLSFDVIKGVDLDENGMRQAINEFARAIADAQVALLFYAGHGLQVEGQNYLLPVNAELTNEIDLQFQGVSMEFLLRIMESPGRTSIVLLDACRNNPLAERLARSMNNARGRTIAPGLARIETGVGTYIGFSTSPDSVALDGDGDNSPFTAALLEHIDAEGEDIESVMRSVREDVIKTTNGSQVPWGNSSLVGKGFVFNDIDADATVAEQETPAVSHGARSDVGGLVENLAANRQAGSSADKQVEMAFWESIKDSTDPRFFQAYIDQYPDGVFAGLARLKIGLLSGQTTQGAAAHSGEFEQIAAMRSDAVPVDASPPSQGGEPKLASLPDQEADDAPAGEEMPAGPELVSKIQAELNRVGCTVGAVDGIWGRRSQAALEDFSARAGLEPSFKEPSATALTELRAAEGRICPLTCRRGYVERDGQCLRATVNQRKAIKNAVRKKAAGAPATVQRKGVLNSIHRLHESNRHMPPGVDSDGGQG